MRTTLFVAAVWILVRFIFQIRIECVVDFFAIAATKHKYAQIRVYIYHHTQIISSEAFNFFLSIFIYLYMQLANFFFDSLSNLKSFFNFIKTKICRYNGPSLFFLSRFHFYSLLYITNSRLFFIQYFSLSPSLSMFYVLDFLVLVLLVFLVHSLYLSLTLSLTLIYRVFYFTRRGKSFKLKNMLLNKKKNSKKNIDYVLASLLKIF